jgi:hypothetical protein
MTENPVTKKAPAQQVVKDIRRATRKLHSSEEKIRIVLSGFRDQPVPYPVIGVGQRPIGPRGARKALPRRIGEGLGIGGEEGVGDRGEVVAALKAHVHVAEFGCAEGIFDAGEAVAEVIGGYRRIHIMLDRQGIVMNLTKLRRLYREARLQVRKRGGRKRALGTRRPMAVPQAANERWSRDFISDAFTDGRRFRVLTVVDDFTRECLTLVADTSLSGTRVVRELDAVIARRGCPGTIVSDRAIVRHWFKGNGEGDRVHLDRGPVLVPAHGANSTRVVGTPSMQGDDA